MIIARPLASKIGTVSSSRRWRPKVPAASLARATIWRWDKGGGFVGLRPPDGPDYAPHITTQDGGVMGFGLFARSEPVGGLWHRLVARPFHHGPSDVSAWEVG